MTVQPITVVGAGGFGREVADVIEAINANSSMPLWDFVGIYDDAPSDRNIFRLGDRGISFLGPVPREWDRSAMNYVVGIGNPVVRENVARKLDLLGWSPATLIHPTAVLGSRTYIGRGSVVCGGVQVSTNVRLGHQVHLNPNSTIGHDADIDDFVSVNPGATVSGEVHVGRATLLGANSITLQGIRIGSDAVVGASACVTRDVLPGSVVKGIPAK